MRLSFDTNHRQASAHRRCIRTPLAPQTRGEMLRTTIRSQEQTGVQLSEGSIEALTTRARSTCARLASTRLEGVGDWRLLRAIVRTREEVRS